MTTNSLRNKELREKERSNKNQERINEERYKREDKTERRGQNLRAASSALQYLGGRQASRDAQIAKSVDKGVALAASLNDWEWYASNESIAKDTASLAWGYRTGSYQPLARDIEDHTPGIITLDLLPSIGISRDSSSGVNAAARQIYSWVRHANSGSANYESADLMQYLVCLGNMYAIYGHCTRILGLLSAASHENAYLPKGVLKAMSIDYDQSVPTLASDRAWLNTLGLLITRSWAAPKDMAYYKRMLFLFSHVYVDTPDSQFGQYYLFKPMGFYTYAENEDMARFSGISYVEGETVRGDLYTVFSPNTLHDWLGLLNGMYEALTRSETAGIMSGDLRKAYGENNLWELPMIAEDYTVFPHYDQVVLNQFWNATVGATYPTVDLHIRQNAQSGALMFTPRVRLTNQNERTYAYLEADTTERRITTDITDPDWRVTLEVTRCMYFTARSDDEGDNERVYDVITCGSEIVGRGVVWTFSGSSGTLNFMSMGDSQLIGPGNNTEALMCAAFHKFYYHPCIDMLTPSSTNASNAYFYRIMNLDRMAIMSPTTLQALNDAVMVNMFYVPNRQ